MSNIPSDLKYTKDNAWIRVNGTQATIGITDYAQQQLGEVVFVELPNVGDKVNVGDAMGTIESVKAVAEYYASVSGTIAEVNTNLQDDPESLNDDPYGGDSWLVKINMSNPKEADSLMNAAAYTEFLADSE